MAPKTPKSMGDPTDPQGTQRLNESPASNKEQPPYRPLVIKEHTGGPRLPEDLRPGDMSALIALFLTPQLLQEISEATNAYARLVATKLLKNFPPVTPRELQTWLGVHIYMTLTPRRSTAGLLASGLPERSSTPSD